MRRFLLYTLLALPVLALFMWWMGGIPRQTGYQDLPWQVETRADGQQSRVFGITLGETTLDEVREKLRLFPSLGLFVQPAGSRTLEAYFGAVRLGPFEANLVTILDADGATLARITSDGVSSRPMPSGARRLELSEAELAAALALVVTEITYVPRARYDEEVVLRRFGEPAQRLPTPDGRHYWLYPDKGLALMLNDHGRDMLHYVRPSAFPALRTRILRGEALEPVTAGPSE